MTDVPHSPGAVQVVTELNLATLAGEFAFQAGENLTFQQIVDFVLDMDDHIENVQFTDMLFKSMLMRWKEGG